MRFRNNDRPLQYFVPSAPSRNVTKCCPMLLTHNRPWDILFSFLFRLSDPFNVRASVVPRSLDHEYFYENTNR